MHNDQSIVERLRIGTVRVPEIPAAGVVEILGREPDADELATGIATGFEHVLQCPVRAGALTPEEEERAAGREEHYADPAWTWRR